jgi:hypothetical protein
VAHKDEWFPGEHPSIIDAETFEAVQERLQSNGRLGGNDFRNRYHALLKRILRCKHCDSAMTHVFQGKHAQVPLLHLLVGHAQGTQHLPASDAACRGHRAARRGRASRLLQATRGQARGARGAREAGIAVGRAACVAPERLPRRVGHARAPGRVELVQLAVREVEYDGIESSVEVHFHGTESLATGCAEAREEAA